MRTSRKSASRHNQIIVGNLRPVLQANEPLFVIEADHLTQHNLDVFVPMQRAPNRQGKIARREDRGYHLIQQRLKRVMIFAINQLPIDLGSATDQVFLIAFETGLRGRISLANAVVKIGGVSSRVDYVGSTPGYVGLDQVNVLLDRSLVGEGEADVCLTLDGNPANIVKINIK